MRGEILPVHDLAGLLGSLPPERPRSDDTISLVVVNLDGRQMAYLVDRFLREGDYVLKPLPGAVGELPWLSGSMITPTGRVILVLDPLKLHEYENL